MFYKLGNWGIDPLSPMGPRGGPLTAKPVNPKLISKNTLYKGLGSH